MNGGRDIIDRKTSIAERMEHLCAEFERSWAAVLHDRALAAFEQPLFALDTDHALPEYAPQISSVCFVGFSMGYHLHYCDSPPAEHGVPGPATSPTVEQTAADGRAEFDRVFFPYLYLNAYATYVDALVPLVERPPKSRDTALRAVCWLGFCAGYNGRTAAQENPTDRGGWRDTGRGLPPLDAEDYRGLTADFEELWPEHLAGQALEGYFAAMSAAEEDDAIERIDVLANVCFGSFYAGAHLCYNAMPVRAKDPQATHQEAVNALIARVWQNDWRDIVYPPALEAHMTAVAPPTAGGDLGLEYMLKQVCRVAFIHGYNIGVQTCLDALMASRAELEHPGRRRAERV